jgi:hypothetical protein
MHTARPENLSVLLSSLAQLGLPQDAHVLRLLRDRAVAKSSVFSAVEVAEFLCALASFPESAGAFTQLRQVLEAMADRMETVIGDMPPEQVSAAFSVFAALKFKPCSSTLTLMAERVLECCVRFPALSAVDMLCACSKNRYLFFFVYVCSIFVRSMLVASDTRLLKALMEHVQALAHELAPGHVTSVLWALAKLRQKPTNSLFAALSQRVTTMSLCLVPGDISTIMWSLTMLGMEADAVTNSQKSSLRHFYKYVVNHHPWHRCRRSDRFSQVFAPRYSLYRGILKVTM